MNDWLITRDNNPKPSFPLLSEMYVEKGDQTDWNLLSDLHYKMDTLPVGASYWKLTFREETIGVCVVGMSRPLLKERHAIFPKMTPGNDTQISNIHRYRIINDNFRVVGRFVLDTMFRSSGAGYRFLNLASRMHGFKYMEIQSSMSKYNFFAQKAGFVFTKPIHSLQYEKGLKFMRKWFAAHPADQEALMEEYRLMSSGLQTRVEKELKEFYTKHSSLEKTGSRRHYSDHVIDNWNVQRTIGKIQGLCFASPLYGVYTNPDIGRELPSKLPILAFDRQGMSQPLNLSLLALTRSLPND